MQPKTLENRSIQVRKILQIVPTSDWYARYRSIDDSITYSPLTFWVLYVDNDGKQRVNGMDVDANCHIDFCDTSYDFDGYWHESHLGEKKYSDGRGSMSERIQNLNMVVADLTRTVQEMRQWQVNMTDDHK